LIYNLGCKTNPSGYSIRKNTDRNTFVPMAYVVGSTVLVVLRKMGRICQFSHIKKTLYDTLQKYKHIWILKSRGIGCSEFLLRYITWSCVSGLFPQTSRVCFIVGPRIDLAEDLIARVKGLLRENLVNDRTQSTVVYLNGVRVEAFPSHHVDTMRGLTDVKFILSDESDMYPLFQQREARAVIEVCG
jgi:hypothetical protein